MEKVINEHVIKLSGKATLLEPLDLSRSFKLEVDGAVIESSDADNQDGTFTRSYKFKPTIIKVLNDNGEVTRTKDTRSMSQQMRAVLTREWRESNETITAEEYYEREMKILIHKRINQEI